MRPGLGLRSGVGLAGGLPSTTGDASLIATVKATGFIISRFVNLVRSALIFREFAAAAFSLLCPMLGCMRKARLRPAIAKASASFAI